MLRSGTDLVDGLLDLGRLDILRRAAAERGGEIVGADEQRIDAWRCRNRIDIVERGCGFNHGERERALVRLTHVVDRRRARALHCHGAQRTPAALAERRILRRGRELHARRRRC